MKYIKILFLTAVCLFVQSFAHAAPSQLIAYSWTIPTTRADATPLPASELAGYTIVYSIDGGAPQSLAVATGSSVSKVLTLTLPARTTPYSIVSGMTATDIYGLTSASSALVTTKVNVSPSSAPSAPGSVSVTITCVSGSCTLTVN